MINEAAKVFRIVEYDEADAELRSIYDETMQMMGVPFVLNWFKCQGSNPQMLKGNWEKMKGTLIQGTIPPLLKQLIMYQVSSLRGCKYCTFIHKVTADGLGQALHDANPQFAVTENINTQYLPTSFLTAIRIVTKCALSPEMTTDEDFEELFEEGFSDAEVQELMAQADLINLLNTMADVSGIAIDQELLSAV